MHGTKVRDGTYGEGEVSETFSQNKNVVEKVKLIL
jgi:hypothetical protein